MGFLKQFKNDKCEKHAILYASGFGGYAKKALHGVRFTKMI